MVSLKESKDSEAVGEFPSVTTDVIPENEPKVEPEIEKSNDAIESEDRLTPEFSPETQGKAIDRVAAPTVEEAIPLPRSSC